MQRNVRRVLVVGAVISIAGACSGGAATTFETDQTSTTSVSAATVESPVPDSPESTVASSTTTTTLATTTTEAPVRHVRTVFSGDVLVHSSIWKRAQRYAGSYDAYHFAPMFTTLEPIVGDADLAICHLEVPIAPEGEEPQTYPRYGAPREIVDGIVAAGYDRCSTASNHTFDQGREGIFTTVEALLEAGLTQSGMARNAEEDVPQILDINGVKVAHIAYTRGYPTVNVPDDAPWLTNSLEADMVLADARRARDLGAEIVIISCHWGTEPQSPVTSTQRDQAEAITASGLVDLIVGHHTHVVQPIEKVNGVWTVFGMGNSISNMPVGPYPPASQDGALVQVDFDVAADGSVTVHQPVVYPTWVDKGDTFAILDVLTELAKPDLSAYRRQQMEISLERTRSVVGEFVASAPYAG